MPGQCLIEFSNRFIAFCYNCHDRIGTLDIRGQNCFPVLIISSSIKNIPMYFAAIVEMLEAIKGQLNIIQKWWFNGIVLFFEVENGTLRTRIYTGRNLDEEKNS